MTLSLSIWAMTGAIYAQSTEAHWITNMDEAKKVASESNQLILMSFQGSDWCGNCRRLDKALFQDEKFKQYTAENYVLLQLDFPMKKENRLSKEQTAHNEALAEAYNVDGVFPKVLVFDATGKMLGEMEYPQQSVEGYINSLKSFR